MGIVLCVVLGALAGLLTSRIVDRGRESPGLDVMLGVVGAIAFGVVARFLEDTGVLKLAQPGVWALAVGGAALVLALHHVVARSGWPRRTR
jgi:uncharacterized membrane protein YeaQ/YmgE (transglycosylase-associated protein family)